jgi:hypothetical protein
MKGWEEYTGEYKPVIQIEASPRLGPDIGFKLDLKKLSAKNTNARRLKYRSDFYSMKLFCGKQEIEPIHPARVPVEMEYHTKDFEISDASFEGIYTYPYDAISKACPAVTLQIFSEKEPDKPLVKILDAKTVARVDSDFQPYRENLSLLSTRTESVK